jgi:hypothetical protein
MAGGVHDDAGADGVARDRRAAAPHGERRARAAGNVVHRQQIVDVAGEHDDLWHDAIVRRVG